MSVENPLKSIGYFLCLCMLHVLQRNFSDFTSDNFEIPSNLREIRLTYLGHCLFKFSGLSIPKFYCNTTCHRFALLCKPFLYIRNSLRKKNEWKAFNVSAKRKSFYAIFKASLGFKRNLTFLGVTNNRSLPFLKDS